MTGDTEGPREPANGGGDARTAPGWVLWITGLAGAGKTTLARALVARLRAAGRGAVLLDGDALRDVFEHDLGYSPAARARAARRYARLARLLAAQGLDVVVATISMFHACRQWNRAHIPRYYEVYLRAAPATLAARSPLHRDAAAGAARAVVGADLPFEEPASPDLALDVDGIGAAAVARRVWAAVRRLPREEHDGDRVGLH